MSCVLAPDSYRPDSSRVRVDIGARSHQGTVRSTNDDHYLVLRLGRHQETMLTSLPHTDLPGRFDECGFAMLVADGLGESGNGAVASRVALSALAHLAIHFGQWSLRVDPVVAAELKERGEFFYQRANEAVVERAGTHQALTGIATTVTAAYTAGADLFIAHVGHSRAYLCRDGTITQLTRDHTLAWHLEHTGGLAPVDGVRDLQHILTETIGGSSAQPTVDIEHMNLLDGDALLLCTNGLSDVVSEDRIADVLSFRRTADEQCRLLVDLALRSGAEDNVTAVLCQFNVPPS